MLYITEDLSLCGASKAEATIKEDRGSIEFFWLTVYLPVIEQRLSLETFGVALTALWQHASLRRTGVVWAHNNWHEH
jgi:hypothetical protein